MSAKGRPERELLPLGGTARSAKGALMSAKGRGRRVGLRARKAGATMNRGTNVRARRDMNMMSVRILAIATCGVIGGLGGWWSVGWLGLDGTAGAVAAAMIAMVVATAAFVGVTTLARTLTRSG